MRDIAALIRQIEEADRTRKGWDKSLQNQCIRALRSAYDPEAKYDWDDPVGFTDWFADFTIRMLTLHKASPKANARIDKRTAA